jgi:Family of unknown function (DUF6463)
VRRRLSRAGNGGLLGALALAHAVVGALFYRRELARIGRGGLLGAGSFRGPDAPAFWFFVNSPLLLIIARLTRRAERSGDAAALREASSLSLAAALLGVICLPVSGFWGWLAISLRGLRDAHRLSV